MWKFELFRRWVYIKRPYAPIVILSNVRFFGFQLCLIVSLALLRLWGCHCFLFEYAFVSTHNSREFPHFVHISNSQWFLEEGIFCDRKNEEPNKIHQNPFKSKLVIPETNIRSPLKMDGWKTSFLMFPLLLGPGLFSGAQMLVLGSVVIIYYSTFFSIFGRKR